MTREDALAAAAARNAGEAPESGSRWVAQRVGDAEWDAVRVIVPRRERESFTTSQPTPSRALEPVVSESGGRFEGLGSWIGFCAGVGVWLVGVPVALLGGAVLTALVVIAGFGGHTGGTVFWRTLSAAACLLLAIGLMWIRWSRMPPGGGHSSPLPWPRRMGVARGEEQDRRSYLWIGGSFLLIGLIALAISLAAGT